MERNIRKIEVALRISAVLLSLLTALLIGFDSETKIMFYTIKRTASYKDLDALSLMMHVVSAAAGYNLLQLVRMCCSTTGSKGRPKSFYRYLAWVCLILDQVGVYVVFSANTALFQASMLAVTGEKSLQWMKVCNKFTRFCVQIGGALLCGYVTMLMMALVAFLSSFSLFSLYSPKHFLLPKGSWRENPISSS